jgi:hypothetical protein
VTISDVQKTNEQVFRVPMKDVYYTYDSEDVCKTPRLVRVGRIATTCITKRKHYYVNKRRYDVSS